MPIPSQAPPVRTVLADALRPRTVAPSRARAAVTNVLLLLAGTGVVAVLAQISVPLPFTPVPLTLGTLGALLVGAALGPWRATASLALYAIGGAAGVCWFAGGASGWAFASFGYVLGFVLAAALAGTLARRGADRSVWGSAGLMVLGTLSVYAAGVPWLALFLGIDAGEALRLGVLPFLVGDVVKAALVAGLLPAAWALVARTRR